MLVEFVYIGNNSVSIKPIKSPSLIITEKDANDFLSYVKWENIKVREIIYCIGIPNIVNWQLSLKKGYIVYYDDNFLLGIE